MLREGDTILTKSWHNLFPQAGKLQARYCLFQVDFLVVLPAQTVSSHSAQMLRFFYNLQHAKEDPDLWETGDEYNLNHLSLMFKVLLNDMLVYSEGYQSTLFRQTREFSLKLFLTATSAHVLLVIKNP